MTQSREEIAKEVWQRILNKNAWEREDTGHAVLFIKEALDRLAAEKDREYSEPLQKANKRIKELLEVQGKTLIALCESEKDLAAKDAEIQRLNIAISPNAMIILKNLEEENARLLKVADNLNTAGVSQAKKIEALKTESQFQYINNYYGLNLKKHCVVVDKTGRRGQVVSARGQYIYIQFDGEEKHWGPFHPTDGLSYPEKP